MTNKEIAISKKAIEMFFQALAENKYMPTAKSNNASRHITTATARRFPFNQKTGNNITSNANRIVPGIAKFMI